MSAIAQNRGRHGDCACHAMTASLGQLPAMVTTPCISHGRPEKKAHRAAVLHGEDVDWPCVKTK